MCSELKIKGFVIHRISKQAHTANAVLTLSKQKLSVGEKEISFIGKVRQSYYQRSYPVYGEFGADFPVFHEYLRTYLLTEDQKINEDGFFEFSEMAAKHYKSVLESSSPATGGNLFFVLYTFEKSLYLMVFAMNNKKGYAIDEETMTIEDIESLDISMVDTAAQIDLTLWLGPNDKADSYLSFVRGKKELSQYFQDFIGCKDALTATASSNRLAKAIDEFLRKENTPHEDSVRIKDSVFADCQQRMIERRPITLSAVSSIVSPEDPIRFSSFASSETYQVGEFIRGDLSVLRKMKYVEFRSQDFSIVFDSIKLNDSIIYNSRNKTLLIKSLPERFIEELEQWN